MIFMGVLNTVWLGKGQCYNESQNVQQHQTNLHNRFEEKRREPQSPEKPN